MNAMTFGEWIRQNRTQRGLTQRELGEAADVNATYISKIERGDISLPGSELREQFHAVLGTTDDDLAEVGILYRLESPVPGGGPVYLNPVNLRVFNAEETARIVREPAAPYDARQRLTALIDGSTLTTGQIEALVTILEAFREMESGRRRE